MSRRTRTLVPVSSSLLKPKVVESVQEKLQVKRQKAKSYHDKNIRILPQLEVGEEVRVANQKSKIWDAGKCVGKCSDRSYLVQVNGETLRRNRVALRSKRDNGNMTNASTEVGPLEEESPSVPKSRVESAPQSTSTQELVKSSCKESLSQSDAESASMKPGRIDNVRQGVQSSPKVVRTRTRTIRAPVRFGDYV